MNEGGKTETKREIIQEKTKLWRLVKKQMNKKNMTTALR